MSDLDDEELKATKDIHVISGVIAGDDFISKEKIRNLIKRYKRNREALISNGCNIKKANNLLYVIKDLEKILEEE
mgnify:CR=1 FL=1